jgi:hypothetical protein
LSLGITLCIVVTIIYCFNYYPSVAKDLDFKRRFLEMTSSAWGSRRSPSSSAGFSRRSWESMRRTLG